MSDPAVGHHEVRLRCRRGPLSLDVCFTLTAPWTVLFAPSGGGKTTILRMIAGLEDPEEGFVVSRISLPGESRPEHVMLDTKRKVSLPAYRRGVRLLAQRPTLFPHYSVAKNVLYRIDRKADRGGGDDGLDEVLALCRVNYLRDKMPGELSGGERQRVALARTMATGGCRLLLLDEAFTGLEYGLREELIRDLREWTARRGIPVLMVTHDVGEVFLAGAEVLRLEAGRIVAAGPAGTVLAEERDRLKVLLSLSV